MAGFVEDIIILPDLETEMVFADDLRRRGDGDVAREKDGAHVPGSVRGELLENLQKSRGQLSQAYLRIDLNLRLAYLHRHELLDGAIKRLAEDVD